MYRVRIAGRLVMGLVLGSLSPLGIDILRELPVSAQTDVLTLASGFTPNPTVLVGTGGGDRPAAEVVNMRNSPTGPCLGFISTQPHEEVTLDSRFSNLEIRVEADLDTTLIVAGPDGVWCNDDRGSHNPAIAGEWLAGSYRIWVGNYQAGEVPRYELSITDNP